MSIELKLEKAILALTGACNEAVQDAQHDLADKISDLLTHAKRALALTDPGESWVEETRRSFSEFLTDGSDRVTRFAAYTAAGELRKFAEPCEASKSLYPDLWRQIAALESIAKGGGE